MLDQAEAGRAVDEGRAEDRHVMLVGELDEAVLLLGVALAQPLAHLADERAARVGLRLQAVGDLADRVVAILQLLLVDIGVVDAVDVERAQRIIVRDFIGLVVLVAKRFEEIHVDDGGAGGDDRIDHVGAHQLGIEVHAAAGRGRAGDHQDHRAVLVLEHRVVDVGGAAEVAAGEAHLAHRVDDRARVELGDVDMLDRVDSSSALRVSLICGVLDLVQRSVVISAPIASSPAKAR